MGNFTEDLSIEETRIRLLYSLLHGLVDQDLREQHVPGDVRSKFKEELEIKGWNRNDWLPIETWSDLEFEKIGWAWNSSKLAVWFLRTETSEGLGIDMTQLREFLTETQTTQSYSFTCSCGLNFNIPEYEHPAIVKQALQWSNGGTRHRWHSACLFVLPDAFTNRRYLSLLADKPLGNQYRFS